MPSPTGGARGFSLLELLVALFVIVLIVSLVSLNVSSPRTDLALAAEVRHVVAVSEYAAEEAQLAGRDFGLRISRLPDERGDTVYRLSWWERWQEGWREAGEGAEPFEPVSMPAGVEVVLLVSDILAEIPADANPPAPQVIFFASGEVTPGELQWREQVSGEISWSATWDVLGRFELLSRGVSDPAAGDV